MMEQNTIRCQVSTIDLQLKKTDVEMMRLTGHVVSIVFYKRYFFERLCNSDVILDQILAFCYGFHKMYVFNCCVL